MTVIGRLSRSEVGASLVGPQQSYVPLHPCSLAGQQTKPNELVDVGRERSWSNGFAVRLAAMVQVGLPEGGAEHFLLLACDLAEHLVILGHVG